jgi:hypothetical protein
VCVGASGKALLHVLVYSSDDNNSQKAWVKDIDKKQYYLYVTITPSGWSNDDAGLGWLQQVFDVITEDRTRRKWKPLIVYGHGSHLTRAFLRYYYLHKILVAIFPPHSTHKLQPLNVVMFKPLSSEYSKQLTTRLHRSKGLGEKRRLV